MIHMHHEPYGDGEDMDPEIIYTANFLVTALEIGSSGETELPTFKSEVWDHLGLNPGILEPVLVQTEQQLQDTFELIYGYQ